MKIKKSVKVVFLIGGSFFMSELFSADVQSAKNTPNTISAAVQDHKPHQKYRNIIFDLGRVLIEWNPEKIMQTLFSQEIKHISEVTKMPEWLEYDRGTCTNEQMVDRICKLKPALDREKFLIFLDQHKDYMSTIKTGLEMFEMAKQCGYRIYILSNMPVSVFNALYAKYDFFKQVDGMVISGDIKLVKPEAAIYQTLLAKYQLKPEECLFLDDKEENIEAGKALGIDGIVCLDHAAALKKLHELQIFQALNVEKLPAEKAVAAAR